MTLRNPGTAPYSDPEVIRDLVQRVRQLEDRDTTRVGEWAFTINDAGEAVATHPSRPEVVLTPTPVGDTGVVGSPAVSGTTLRMFRAATGTVNFPNTSSGFDTTPDDVFDTVQWASADIDVDLTTATVTLPDEGTYLVDYRIETNAALGTDGLQPVLYKGEDVFARGRTSYTPFSANGATNVGGMWLVRCLRNETLRPGYVSTAAFNIVGDADAVLTYFAVARLGG